MCVFCGSPDPTHGLLSPPILMLGAAIATNAAHRIVHRRSRRHEVSSAVPLSPAQTQAQAPGELTAR
ncbi:MAG: hypothetical protein FJ033_14200 [Chloroflexi bacterium]|nr:hypothetical protein [Chloroflexota bacterium]